VRPLSLTIWSLTGRLASLILPFWLAHRTRRGREIAARLPERRGIADTPRPPGCLLWLHAASVGETASILPVLAALAEQSPQTTVLVTTGSVTSARLLAQREPRLGGAVLHQFVPLDVPCWVARFLDHWRPDAGAFVESELWPNLLMACQARAIPLMLLNARMSAPSLARWSRAPATAQHLLSAFAQVQARSAEDAARLRALGARSVTAPGDLKFAAAPLPFDAEEAAAIIPIARPIWLASSVHPEEAETILTAHRRLAASHPDLLTIIAPRHPDKAARFCGGEIVTRRSAGQNPPKNAGIWLIDTLGDLGLCYTLAPIVLIGGSLFAHGGQNVLEPARFGCAIAVGPYTDNFAVACTALEQVGALTRVSDAMELANWVGAMLADPASRARQGEAARAVAAAWLDLPAQSAATFLSLMKR
jgi:3-deoxy-D-manno-octulosonic-acid transferase